MVEYLTANVSLTVVRFDVSLTLESTFVLRLIAITAIYWTLALQKHFALSVIDQ